MTPQVEVMHDRDPDGYCTIRVWVDGVEVDAYEESIDPGAGHMRSEWDEHTESVRTSGRTAEFVEAVAEARDAAASSPYVMED